MHSTRHLVAYTACVMPSFDSIRRESHAATQDVFQPVLTPKLGLSTANTRPINSQHLAYQQPTLGLSTANTLPINGQHSAYQQPTLCLSTANTRPINSQHSTYQQPTLGLSTANTRPINSQHSAYQQPTVSLSTAPVLLIYSCSHSTDNCYRVYQGVPQEQANPLQWKLASTKDLLSALSYLRIHCRKT